jgi:hypothetical protein
MQMRLLEMVAGVATAAAVVLMLGYAGCGGSQDEAEEPGAGESRKTEQQLKLITEDQYEEINATFDSKNAAVSRCYSADPTTSDDDKGHITVRVTIKPDGSTSNVSVSETSFKSKKIINCVTGLVARWRFPNLPRPLETAHTYVLQPL